MANLSTVATRKEGSSRYTCSSTKMTGRPSRFFAAENSHWKFTHPTMTSSVSDFTVRLSFVRGLPHQGQSVRGKGDEGFFDELFLYSVTCRETSAMVFEVALWPTQSPTENRTSPSEPLWSLRISSSAQMRLAARPS
jgi:hypothetical protein